MRFLCILPVKIAATGFKKIIFLRNPQKTLSGFRSVSWMPYFYTCKQTLFGISLNQLKAVKLLRMRYHRNTSSFPDYRRRF